MSVATAVYEETCKICETISLWFQRVIIQIQRGRQLSANRQIINQLPAIMAISQNKELNYNLEPWRIYDSLTGIMIAILLIYSGTLIKNDELEINNFFSQIF